MLQKRKKLNCFSKMRGGGEAGMKVVTSEHVVPVLSIHKNG